MDRWLEKYGKLEYHKYSTIGRPMKDKDKHAKELSKLFEGLDNQLMDSLTSSPTNLKGLFHEVKL